MARWGGRPKFLWFQRKFEIKIFDDNHEFDNFRSIMAADGKNFEDLVENWDVEFSTRSLNCFPSAALIALTLSNSWFSSKIRISNFRWNQITENFCRFHLIAPFWGCAYKILRILKNSKCRFPKIIRVPNTDFKPQKSLVSCALLLSQRLMWWGDTVKKISL